MLRLIERADGGDTQRDPQSPDSPGKYVRGDALTNTVEGFYSVFKRGMKGAYQHCSEKHLHRYVAEFGLRGIVGKRLTYAGTDRSAE